MQKSVKIGIGIAILMCVILAISLVTWSVLRRNQEEQCVKLEGEKTCFSTTSKPYRYYGTKTAYHIGVQDYKFDLNVGNCTPKVFYHLIRHAARYPDEKEIRAIQAMLPPLKERIINESLSGKVLMCKEDISKLRKWNNNWIPENGKELSLSGKIEAEELGQRLRKRFPSILNQPYSKEKFTFEYTGKERTKSSAQSFAKGIFNENYINVEMKENDELLLFHKKCKKLRDTCNDTYEDDAEVVKFKTGSLVKSVVESISKRIGITLNYEQVKVIRTACVFEYALKDGDIWCSLFSTDELKVLEYLNDIDDYYKDSYGNKINYEQACPYATYITDMFKKFGNASESKATFQFSHSGALKKVISMFGLFEDEKALTSSNFCSQGKRKWRTSLIVPFNSNIGLTLYQCGNVQKVVAFQNERPVKVKGCNDVLCPLENFYKTYTTIGNNCNVRRICCKCCNH